MPVSSIPRCRKFGRSSFDRFIWAWTQWTGRVIIYAPLFSTLSRAASERIIFSFLEANYMRPHHHEGNVEDFLAHWLCLLTVHPRPSVVLRSTCVPASAGTWAAQGNPSSQTPASGRLPPSTACGETGRWREGRAGRLLPSSPGGTGRRGCVSVILLAPTRQPSHCISPPGPRCPILPTPADWSTALTLLMSRSFLPQFRSLGGFHHVCH